ncbi:cyclic nucleotide-binding domain-containing protein [Thiopseudomonas acetoxidans]|uniref:Cyclic nucleotide-binding domain-containing protein n=1 Tax=Thiopseudomonas acetoxidans TaxID=3041622 RepID=A0ABT7SRY9_9GAMM|nr:cyclic nucleotide-binding domain-containing protein [Thiopseudomonas sp. CY1220]MDM7858954.1 cyclic nucleotide-binding domain-containing protein [Thiopseudomonas sp. CY1220]
MNSQLTVQQLKTFIPFNQLSDTQLAKLRAQLSVQLILAGHVLFEQGNTDNQSYFLLTGNLSLHNQQQEVSLISAEDEQSLYELAPQKPRQYRAVAETDAVVIKLDTEKLAQLLAWRQMMQDVLLDLEHDHLDLDWLEKLLVNPLFSNVPAQNIREILQRLKPVKVAAGSEIIRQGAVGETCYFLRTGRAQVTREQEGELQVLAELEEGACFGEEALLSDQPRNANISMLEDGQVLELSRQDFVELLKAPVVAECSLEQAQQQLEQQQGQWLDVRRQDEYEQAHAFGALHMPLDVLRLKSRLLNKEVLYFCYCDNGKRSQNAVFLLTQLGFKAKMLAGGTDSLSVLQRDELLSEQGAGYLVRRGGRIEVSQ